jgi:hypothetical protein
MKFISSILLVLFSTLAFSADYVDVSKLTREQRAEIQLQVERTVNKSSDPSVISSNVRNEATQWADLGKNVGTALVASAKEVGQGVNEFSQTPVGQLTTAIIVYKVIGRDILGLVFGSLVLIVGSLAAFLIYRNFGVSNRKYENIPRLNGLWISKKCTERYRESDFEVGSQILTICTLVISWVTGLNIVF